MSVDSDWQASDRSPRDSLGEPGALAHSLRLAGSLEAAVTQAGKFQISARSESAVNSADPRGPASVSDDAAAEVSRRC